MAWQTKSCNIMFPLIVFLVMLVSTGASGFQFGVGGRDRGWKKPSGTEKETYNHWAMKNRFHVGDSVYFKYANDSVLVVDRKHYSSCNTTNPLLKFDDGSTVFRFDRYGFFYFISGVPGHCKSGQRLIIRVMVHPAHIAPAPGPVQQGGHEDSSFTADGPSETGEPSFSSKLNARSTLFMAALGVVLVISKLV